MCRNCFRQGRLIFLHVCTALITMGSIYNENKLSDLFISTGLYMKIRSLKEYVTEKQFASEKSVFFSLFLNKSWHFFHFSHGLRMYSQEKTSVQMVRKERKPYVCLNELLLRNKERKPQSTVLGFSSLEGKKRKTHCNLFMYKRRTEEKAGGHSGRNICRSKPFE